LIEIGGIGKKYPPQSEITMPNIPEAFLKHDKVKHVFFHIINDFDYEERVAIYFYCFENLPISEIADLTKLSQDHVASVLTLYCEKLAGKVYFFKKAMPYSIDDHVTVREILLPECEAIS